MLRWCGVKGTTMEWCTKSCPDFPMRCGRRVYLNMEEYAAEVKRKRGSLEEGKEAKNQVNKDFKIDLAAMMSPADYKIMEE